MTKPNSTSSDKGSTRDEVERVFSWGATRPNPLNIPWKIEPVMILRADLHLHTRYSGGASPESSLGNLTKAAGRMGLDLIGSGDCLHPAIIRKLRELTSEEGVFRLNGVDMVLQCEIEDLNRAHHLVFFPSVSKIEEFREAVGGYSPDLDDAGRPTAELFGFELAEMASESGGIVGPAHLFTPYTGALPLYGDLERCYRESLSKIGFIELGLSADTFMANPIGELREFPFLSNSDAHSTSVRRLGREFNLVRMKELTFDNLRRALTAENLSEGASESIVANYGLPPQEGRYHLTACSECHKAYSRVDARRRRMRCDCGGFLKLGVKDITGQRHDLEKHEMPRRPPYRYRLPLVEIIAEARDLSARSERTMEIYGEILELAGDELSLFAGEDVVRGKSDKTEELKASYPAVARGLGALANKTFVASPGGGGKYGHIRTLAGGSGVSSGEEEGMSEEQRSLFEF